MQDIDYEILDALGTARRSLRLILDELGDKAKRDDRLESILCGCHALLDETSELEEEYAGRASADEENEDRYRMEDAS